MPPPAVMLVGAVLAGVEPVEVTHGVVEVGVHVVVE